MYGYDPFSLAGDGCPDSVNHVWKRAEGQVFVDYSELLISEGQVEPTQPVTTTKSPFKKTFDCAPFDEQGFGPLMISHI